MKGLFDRQLLSNISPSKQCIRSSHSCLVRKYIETFNDHFKDHNIPRELKEAQQHYYNANEVKRLNKLISEGMLHAEN